MAGCSSGEAAWESAATTPSLTPDSAPTDLPSASPTASPSPSPPADTPLAALLRRYLGTTPQNPKRPMYAGAVALVLINGKVAMEAVVGDALRWGAGTVELSPTRRVPMRLDSVFDLASITKVYTALLVLQQVEKGRLELEAPVSRYSSEFDVSGKSAITVAQLLAHTGALPVGANIRGLSSVDARWAAVMATAPVSGATPGDAFRYSSVGLMVLGRLVEKVTGTRLDQALRNGLTGPMGLSHTGFRPSTWMSASERDARMVATDARSSRGLLRGVVHDDVCNALGGIAGHAGVFSTAADLAAIGQMMLDGGVYRGKRILAEASIRKMLANVNQGLPAHDPERPNRPSDHGLGVTLNQPWLMGRLAAADAFGHSGFTGTSLVVSPRRKLVLVLLTNRAHPNWSWANPDPVRVAVGNLVAG